MSWIMEVKSPVTGEWLRKEFDNNHREAAIEWALNINASDWELYHS